MAASRRPARLCMCWHGGRRPLCAGALQRAECEGRLPMLVTSKCVTQGQGWGYKGDYEPERSAQCRARQEARARWWGCAVGALAMCCMHACFAKLADGARDRWQRSEMHAHLISADIGTARVAHWTQAGALPVNCSDVLPGFHSTGGAPCFPQFPPYGVRVGQGIW